MTKGRYCYDYPRPAVTVDCAVLQWQPPALRILLIRRGRDPFAGRWALPGGFVDIDEPIPAAAARELREETGLDSLPLEQFGVFGTPGRDPRGRTISIAFCALIPADRPVTAAAGDDASGADWFDLRSLPPLAFDHADVIRTLGDHLAAAVCHRARAFDLLGETFALADLQAVYETVLARPIDPVTLHARLTALGLLIPTAPSSSEPPAPAGSASADSATPDTTARLTPPRFRFARPRLEALLRDPAFPPFAP